MDEKTRAAPRDNSWIAVWGPFRYTKILQILFFDRPEEKHSHESRATKRLLAGTSELDKIIGSRVTIQNVELKVRMKKRSTDCLLHFTSIRQPQSKSAGVLTRQIDFSIPLSARNSLSVAHAKSFDKTSAHHRQIHSFSCGAFLYRSAYLKQEKYRSINFAHISWRCIHQRRKSVFFN